MTKPQRGSSLDTCEFFFCFVCNDVAGRASFCVYASRLRRGSLVRFSSDEDGEQIKETFCESEREERESALANFESARESCVLIIISFANGAVLSV